MKYINPEFEEIDFFALPEALMASVNETVSSGTNETFTEGDELYFD